jgi:glycosyltransferase involved in cell wall biosynthesis
MLMDSNLSSWHELTLLNQSRGDEPQAGRFTTGNVGRLLRDARDLWRAAAGQDVVHLHTALAPGVTAVRAGVLGLVARARGARVVVHAHGGRLLLWMTTPGRRRLMRGALAPAHRVLAVSSVLQSALAGAAHRRIDLVDNGVDVERFSLGASLEHDPPRVLYVGLLTPRKGVLDLIEASGLLADRGVPHELLLVGGTPSEGGPAEEQVRSAVRDSSAQLLGERLPEQMPAVYAQADILCLASWYEAMPLSVLEAFASGLPVVATDVGDVGRVVLSGQTGALAEPRNPTSLADALEPLLRDAGLRRRLAAAGRRRVVEHFSSAQTARSVHDVYQQETRPA